MTPVLRWGVLGAGRIAGVVAPAIAVAAGAEVVAVAARDRDRAAGLVPGARAYGSYEHLVSDPDVDAVYCSLANHAHVPWALAALEAGKHVLCEKPLGMTTGQVEAAAAAAARAGRLLVEASWYRWHPRTRHAERLVAEGALGAVQAVDAGFTFDGVPATNFRMDPAMGGGALYDVGCYALSAVGWALGWPDTAVVGVERRQAESGVDTMTEAVLAAPGGARARVRGAFDEPERQWVEVRGSEGVLRFGPPAFTAWTTEPAALEVEAGGRVETQSFPPCNPYQAMIEAFGDAAAGGDAWVVPLSESLAVARMIDAIGSQPAAASRRMGGSNASA